jgi:hypothetical protein
LTREAAPDLGHLEEVEAIDDHVRRDKCFRSLAGVALTSSNQTGPSGKYDWEVQWVLVRPPPQEVHP